MPVEEQKRFERLILRRGCNALPHRQVRQKAPGILAVEFIRLLLRALISRLTLESASRQIALPNGCRKPDPPINLGITPIWHDIRTSQNHC